ATATSATQVNLSWTDNSINETGFKVERSTDGVNFTQIATVGANVKTYPATGLVASPAYPFRLGATNAAGDSGFSNVAAATTQAAPVAPAAPSGLSASAAASARPHLTWADNR